MPGSPRPAGDLITRTVYTEVPPRVEYALTEQGRGAAVPLAQLRDWVESTLTGPGVQTSGPSLTTTTR
jgi:DNA-binding HxlR family transcriptional regulator